MKHIITNKGFSLIELLVSLIITSILVLAVLELLLTAIQHMRYQQAFLQTRQELALAQHYLTHDIQQAGAAPCVALQHLTINNLTQQFPIIENLHGYTDTSAPDSIKRKMQKGTDVIRLQFTSDKNFALAEDMLSSSSALHLYETLKNSSTRYFLLGNCQHAELFGINRINSRTVSHPVFQNTYSMQAHLAQFIQHSYYLRATTRKDDRGHKIIALYQQNSKNYSRELVEGIDQLHIEYHQHQYKTAAQVSNWRQVDLIKITLAAKSLAYFSGKPITLEKTFYIHVRN